VFALEHQLAWYQHGTKVKVDTVQAVHDQMELRHPPMPDEQAWSEAVRRGQAIFGTVLPQWRSPTNLPELAGSLRRAAAEQAATAEELAHALAGRAGVLGLDPATGRLATARRLATFLANVAGEGDDVVLVDMVARADLGDLDDQAVGTVISQSRKVTHAMASTAWQVLEALQERAGADESARAELDKLRRAAGHDQHAADLAAALPEAVAAAAALLANSGKIDRSEPVASVPDGGERTAGGRTMTRTVADLAAWDEVAAEIRSSVASGHQVTVTWEVP
jgi:hypothetical protein